MEKENQNIEFITTTKPLKGKIKQRYTDFIVEEVDETGQICKVMRYNTPIEDRVQREMIIPQRNNEEHLVLEMEKLNMDTPTAIAHLSRGINVSRKRIGYAGLKDKRALTCQKISIYLPDEELVKKFGVKGMELRNPCWSDKRIELGDLLGNQFTITIRDIEMSEEEIKKILKEFIEESKKGLPNYFGNQRFGGKRMITHKVGKLLLKGKFEEGIMLYLTQTYEEEKEELKNARTNLAKTRDFKKALKEFPIDARSERAILNHLVKHPNDYLGAFKVLPKKIRYLFSHSFQSHIFNKIIKKRIMLFGQKALEPIDGDVLLNGVPAALLPGFESKFAESKAGEIEKKVLEEEKISFEDFKTTKMSELSSKGKRKVISLIPEKFRIEKITNDEFNEGKKAVTISFFLPKGNYATTVLRELLKEEVY